MGRQYSAYIKGTNYNSGSWFTSCANFTGRAASDGTGARSTVTAGTGYQFIFCNPGAAYPYAIGYGGVQASVFPNATYGIYYNANGGTGAPGAQTKTYGYNLALSGTIPTRAGHNFRGWATAPNGGAVYAAGGIYTANAGATLYAVWEPYRHSVAFNANGGSADKNIRKRTYFEWHNTDKNGLYVQRLGHICRNTDSKLQSRKPVRKRSKRRNLYTICNMADQYVQCTV